MMLLAIIRKQYNQMLIISDMLSQGMNKKDIISALGIKPYAADKLIQSARRYTREQLEQYYDKCTKLEFDIKKGDIDDDIAIELIIYN